MKSKKTTISEIEKTLKVNKYNPYGVQLEGNGTMIYQNMDWHYLPYPVVNVTPEVDIAEMKQRIDELKIDFQEIATMSASNLKYVLEKVMPFPRVSSTDNNATGIFLITHTTGAVQFLATDGHILSTWECPATVVSEIKLEFPINLMKRVFARINKLGTFDTVTFFFNKEKTQGLVTVKTQEGAYSYMQMPYNDSPIFPNFAEVIGKIPSKPSYFWDLKGVFAHFLKRVKQEFDAKEIKRNNIVLELSNYHNQLDNVDLIAKSLTDKENQVYQGLQTNGSPFPYVTVNLHLLLEILKVWKECNEIWCFPQGVRKPMFLSYPLTHLMFPETHTYLMERNCFILMGILDWKHIEYNKTIGYDT